MKDKHFLQLHNAVSKLINEYAGVYESVKTSDDWKNPFRSIISDEIPALLRECGSVGHPYSIVGSYGKGRWTSVPWIAVFDTRITTSAQKGVYIVYLLNKDTKELYLTFEIAATEAMDIKSNAEGKTLFTGVVGKNDPLLKAKLKERAAQIRLAVPDDYFESGEDINSGAQGYDSGAVYYKRYSAEPLPTGEKLVEDLTRMMEIYGRYYEWSQGKNTDSEWWPSVEEYTPGISKEQWLELLNNSEVFTPDRLTMMAQFYAIGGQASCIQMAETYGKTSDYYRMACGVHLAERIAKETGCPLCNQENAKFWPVLFVGRDAKPSECGNYIWKLRDVLYAALSEFGVEKYLVSENRVGTFDSWEIVDENTAIKRCDKSFFEHNGSGVPKGISWFFDADSMALGENKNLKLIFKGVEYAGRVSNESTDRRRVRIFWNAELGKQFAFAKEDTDAQAVFKKIADNIYEITLSGGEEELSVKETIEKVKSYIAAKGFTYEDGLIENFYLSLKSKPFVILAGTSGTGKTRLVKLFAEAVGATNANGRYQMVSVRPDWSDSTDLFGHVDLNGRFVPGAIIDFVKRAELDPAKPYFLCLDEMNLARVEYYLSDVLSVIETRDMGVGGKIDSDPLVPSTYYGADTAAAGKYGTVKLPENLYIIGTVNMDETTFPFSRKVLDRANTIEFSYVNLLPKFDEMPRGAASALNLDNGFLKTEYLLLGQCADEAEVVGEYCTELQQLNRTLQIANAHVGYRVRDEIVFYLLNNKKHGLISDNEAMDNELMQKILPRIQGSSASVKKMLCELFKHCVGDYDGLGENGDDISAKMVKAIGSPHCKYKHSAEKIAFMVRRFEEDGFTSYWL